MSKKKFNPVTFGDKSLTGTVEPIRKQSDILRFKKYWLSSKSTYGFRNWVIFEMGTHTGLRASDLVTLQYDQVYKNGKPRPFIIGEIDQKTGKPNHYLDIKSLRKLLIKYNQWLSNHYRGEWLFYKATDKQSHITSHYLYQIMRRAGDALGIAHVGSHTLRKTFGYYAYHNTGSIAYVQARLQQSSPEVTMRYIGVTADTINEMTDKLFGTGK